MVLLDQINHDVLVQIVQYAKEIPRKNRYGEKSCSALNALSLTNKRLREECLPFLFTSIVVKGEWVDTLGRFENMETFFAASTFARTFEFDVSVKGVSAKNYSGMKHPARSLPRQLATTLRSMAQLDKLVLAIPEEGRLDVFEKEFREAKLMLPNVQTLVLSPACDFVVELCPNVRRISTKGYNWRQSDRDKHSIQLLEAAAKAPKLTQFGMMEGWDVNFTEILLRTLPHLRWLNIEPSWSGCDPISQLAPVLGRFPNLQHLALADASLLGVNFDPPWCGNAYDGPDGAKLMEQVQKEQVEAEDRVAKTVGSACPKLLDVLVGQYARVEIVRDAKGNFVDVVHHAYDKSQEEAFWVFHP